MSPERAKPRPREFNFTESFRELRPQMQESLRRRRLKKQATILGADRASINVRTDGKLVVRVGERVIETSDPSMGVLWHLSLTRPGIVRKAEKEFIESMNKALKRLRRASPKKS